MANLSLNALTDIDGIVAAAMVDVDSGLCLASIGTGIDMDIASAGNTDMVRRKRKTMQALGISDPIEDMLITMEKHYHIVRPLTGNSELFLYLVLERSQANLAMARHQLKKYEMALDFN